MRTRSALPRRSELHSLVRALPAALVFLTRIPVGGFPYSAPEWRWAPAHFPVVGAVVGGVSAAIFWACSTLDVGVAAVFAVVASVLCTGAFHEDGLADTADAIFGAHGEKQLFEILKDSRIGTYGAVALVLSLVLRVACLSALGVASKQLAIVALAASHVLARTGPVWMLATLPYVTGKHARGSAVSTAGPAQALVATLWTLLLGVVLWRMNWMDLSSALCSAAVVVLATPLLGTYFRRRAGGITGDFLGATEQVCECLVLVALLACARLP